MQANELVELAAVVAFNAPTLMREPGDFSPAGLEHYWGAAKSRSDRWYRTIKSATCATEGGADYGRRAREQDLRPVVEEIFLAEVLARVWTGLSAARDRLHGVCEIEPIARSVLIGQSEARNRALCLLVQGPGIRLEDAVELNRLRRRSERWNDLLLGCFAGHADMRELAFDAERAADFAAEFRQGAGRPDHDAACRLALASLRAAFAGGRYRASPNADLNAQIAAGILECFPTEIFDSFGLFKSLWMLRIEAKTNDTEGLLAELLAAELGAESEQRGRRQDGPHAPRPPRF